MRVAPPPHRMPTTLRALFALALALARWRCALAWWWPSGAPPYLTSLATRRGTARLFDLTHLMQQDLAGISLSELASANLSQPLVFSGADR